MNRKLKIFLSFTLAFAALFFVITNANTTDASEKNTKTYVIPGGELIGMKVYTDGVYIVNITYVNTENGRKYPGKDAGLKIGDYIKGIDGEKINSIEDFSFLVNKNKEYKLLIQRKDKELETTITPVFSKDHNEYKAGLWVRDSTAGIGTVTYYNINEKTYGALGHAISDKEIKKPLIIGKGKIYKGEILKITKGEDGEPGEIEGGFSQESKEIGNILTNTKNGVFGEYNGRITKDEIEVAALDEVKEGEAEIISTIANGEPEKYKIKIVKMLKSGIYSSKGMIVEITDEELLKITGGIVQGMSGSPIIQNNKIVGAITHVFVNNPKKGYGVFIGDMMANE